ncbi:alpha/beta fold hydrolase [Nocardioides daedukensis]|uniref:alpha/beta fold hydrolase n=1 Tax=Nocardioides daedukensis TaxID=634462 RepID=UPI003CCDE145
MPAVASAVDTSMGPNSNRLWSRGVVHRGSVRSVCPMPPRGQTQSHSTCVFPPPVPLEPNRARPEYFGEVQLVETGGLTIAYQRDGEGPPLVFVHGAAEDSRIWAPQFADLTDEFTVLAWDEPGAGSSSDLPDDFDLADIADGLAAWLETLDLGPAHIAGISWGGTVLLEFYRRHPEHVATLILIGTYAGWKGSLPADEVKARATSTRKCSPSRARSSTSPFPGSSPTTRRKSSYPCSRPSLPTSGRTPFAARCRSWPRPISATCYLRSPSPPC